MHSHDFRHLYPYLDSLHEACPHDPQFYEIEDYADILKLSFGEPVDLKETVE